jgi:hypothetical protein
MTAVALANPYCDRPQLADSGHWCLETTTTDCVQWNRYRPIALQDHTPVVQSPPGAKLAVKSPKRVTIRLSNPVFAIDTVKAERLTHLSRGSDTAKSS